MNNILQNESLEVLTRCEDETYRIGKLLGALAIEGCVIAVVGLLGAGKTYLSKGIANGLGIVDASIVTSPTFAIMNQYNGRLPVYHIDAYRLNSVDEMYDMGCDEIFWGNGVTIVEWADKVEECLPPDIIKIEIEYDGITQRRIKISSTGKKNSEIIQKLRIEI